MLDEIIESCKYVSNNSKSVKINKTRLEEFGKILKGNVEIPLFEERYNIIKNVSKIANQKMNGNFYKFIKNTTIDINDYIWSYGKNKNIELKPYHLTRNTNY